MMTPWTKPPHPLPPDIPTVPDMREIEIRDTHPLFDAAAAAPRPLLGQSLSG